MSAFGKRSATLCVLFLVLTFGGSYAMAVGPQSQPRVKALSVDPDGDAVVVFLTATEDVQYTYFRLDGPRLVLDLHDAANDLGFSERRVDAGGVAQVRTALFRDETREATRVVFDLEEGTRYEVVEEAPGRIRLSFEGPPPADSVASAESSLETGRVEAPLETGRVEAPNDAPGNPVPDLAAGDAVSFRWETPAAVQVASLRATVPFPTVEDPVREAALEIAEQAEEEVEEAGVTAVRPVPAPGQPLPEGLNVAASLTSVPELPVSDPGPLPEPNLAELAGPAGPPAPEPPAQVVSPIPVPEYTGEIYTFDLRGVDLQDFFRTISDISGLNVILDPNIPRQPLTMMLRDVPWDQALDIVLRNYSLAWERTGNVLRIASQDTLDAEEVRRREYRTLQELNAPLAQNTYVLSYTQAETAGPLVSSLLSERGEVIPVQERNALIIRDIETRFESIGNLIDFLDTPAQQVEIEARLLQANKTFRRDLGNQLGIIINNNGSNVLTGLPTAPSPFDRTPPPSVTAGGTDALPLVADFGIAAPTAGLSYLLGVGGDVLLDNIIQIAETRGTARLLSSPSAVTQNNTAAVIEQGTQIPVQTNVNNTITVQFQNFALRLEVTPQITEEGTILLNALIENSTPDFSQQVDGIPSIATQRAETTVLIADGGTAVIGGILIDSDSVNVSQVPGLGSIPILGHLFKSTSTVKSTSELLFFITARIKPADPIDFLMDEAAAASAGLPDSLFAGESPAALLRERPSVPELD